MSEKCSQLIVAVFVLLVLAGCKEASLYTALSEQEANEMVALLHKAGLPASKISGKDNSFSVATEKDRFADAVELLQANGLPRRRFESLGDVFNDEGFVSSNTSQRARYMYALSQEISNTISSIDGVIKARVHLAVPERDPLSDVQVQSSASVFIKHRADVDLSSQVSQIKALVINGLENLPYENVTVALFEAKPQSLYSVSPSDAKKLQILESGNTKSDAAMANKMAFIPEITPMGLIALGLALLTFVLAGILFTMRLKSHEAKNSKML